MKLNRSQIFRSISLYFLTGIIVYLLSCNSNPLSFENVHPLLNQIPNQRILRIPTYDGLFQAVHPDIVFFKNGFNGYPFYLVVTPYPYSNRRYENPCILVSEDGINFQESVPGINPLVQPPPYGYNDDPDMLFITEQKKFNIYYLETMIPDSQNVILLESKDGIHWKKKRVIHYNLKQKDCFILSPSVIFGNNQYRMFYVNISEIGSPIQYLESNDGIKWDKNSIVSLSYSLPEKMTPWHVDVFEQPYGYFMLCCGPYPDTDLYLASSEDLEHWTFIETPILTRKNNFFQDCKRIYRSTGIVDENLLIVWFSFLKYDAKWGIGVKKYDIDQLIK